MKLSHACREHRLGQAGLWIVDCGAEMDNDFEVDDPADSNFYHPFPSYIMFMLTCKLHGKASHHDYRHRRH